MGRAPTPQNAQVAFTVEYPKAFVALKGLDLGQGPNESIHDDHWTHVPRADLDMNFKRQIREDASFVAFDHLQERIEQNMMSRTTTRDQIFNEAHRKLLEQGVPI